MTATLELRDSEVWTIEASAGAVRVLFSAAYVRHSEESSDGDGGEVYAQGVELKVDNATWKGSLQECVGKISDGDLLVADTPVRLVPLPYEAADTVRLAIQFANGAALVVTGTAVHVHHTGEPRFVERYSC